MASKKAPPKPAKKAPSKPARPKNPAPAKAKKAPVKPKKAQAPARGPVQKTRVVIPMSYYEPHKDEIKAPFKAHGMKWNYLGEGKGLYKREKDIHCFTQFLDDGVHYSIWGDDKKGVNEILAAWRALAGEALWAQFTAEGEKAKVAEAEQKESEALRLWKLGEPQRRPGEPDLFFTKRVAEWNAKKPA
jgi:hypothetical protein